MRPFARASLPILGLLMLAVAAVACGGGDEASPTTTSTATGSPTAEGGGVTDAQVRACLESAGIAITGPGDEAPALSGVKAIGLEPGTGDLGPGNVTGAVFLFESEETAESAAESLQGFAARVDQEETVVVMYDSDVPEASLTAAVEGCISA